ncbi:MAG: hypothetical protein EA361_16410 [Bacteroidetes bacterium]|nr:MAG: hypothetical protein EA361_16410 [Bacteroidota bacterium]
MRKSIYIFIFISFMLNGCMEEAEMTPRFYPMVSTEVKTDSLSNSVTFYGKIEKGTDSIIEYGFAYTLKKDIYLPGNFITFAESVYENYSLTLNRGLLPDTKYQVRAYAKTKRFTVFGATTELHTLNYEPKVKDIDGNLYHTILIGNQEWMVENLRVTRYTNGDSLPTFENMGSDSEPDTGVYGIYPHNYISGATTDEEVVERYGLLYNWYAVDNSRGLCPQGWRIPSDEDWMKLEGFSDSQFGVEHPEWLKSGWRGANAGIHLRSRGKWSWSQVKGLNHFELRIYPAGGYGYQSDFYKHERLAGILWSSTTATSENAYFRFLHYTKSDVYREATSKKTGMSVRCMRDVVFEPDFH